MLPIKIDKPDEIVYQVADIFIRECHNVLKEYPELYTDEVKDKIKIIRSSYLISCVNNLISGANKNSRWSVRQIKDSVNSYKKRWDHVTFITETVYTNDENDKFIIKEILVKIIYDALVDDVLTNIHRINDYIELVKIDARHEIGHVLDALKCQQTMSFSEYQKMRKTDDVAMCEHIKTTDQMIEDFKNEKEKHTDEEWNALFKEMDRLYYSTPGEWRADTLGKIDREKWLDFQYNYNMPDKIEIRPIYKGADKNAK